MNLTNQATVNFTMINSDGSTKPLQQQSNIISTYVTPVLVNNYKLKPYIRPTPPPQPATQQQNNSNLRLLIVLLVARLYSI